VTVSHLCQYLPLHVVSTAVHPQDGVRDCKHPQHGVIPEPGWRTMAGFGACTVAMVALSVRSAAARSYARPMLALVAILAASANGGHTGSGARRVMVAYVKHSGEFCSGGTEMYTGAKDTLGSCQALCTDQGCLCFDYEEGSHRCRLKGEFVSGTLQTLIVKKKHPFGYLLLAHATPASENLDAPVYSSPHLPAFCRGLIFPQDKPRWG